MYELDVRIKNEIYGKVYLYKNIFQFMYAYVMYYIYYLL